MNSLTEIITTDEFNPTPDDEAWAAREFNVHRAELDPRTVPVLPVNGHVHIVPANGQPVTLAEIVDHEAMSYRAWHTPEGDFLADQLERVSQLIAWTKATTPQEYVDRLEVWDEEIRVREFDRGYSEGVEAARHELAMYLPR